MATRLRTRQGMTLEEFLGWSRIDEKPYLEYVDGGIEVKVSPKAKHCLIEMRMCGALNAFAGPERLGLALPELRCTFDGQSMVPDVVFLLDRNILTNDRGELIDDISIPPDIHVEIRSPRQTIKRTREKIEHSLANGCRLGWFIDPIRRTIDVYRPGLPVHRLAESDSLDGDPVLPGFRVSFAEVFGWLIYHVQRPENPEVGPR